MEIVKMLDKDELMKIYEKHVAPITKQRAEKLENWCKDFQSIFGWKVNVTHKKPIMVVEVIANRSNYRISAEGNYLSCILEDKEDRVSHSLSDGEFNFDTFAQIMIDILHWESPLRRTKATILARP